MKNKQLLTVIATLAAIVLCLPAIASAQGKPTGATSTESTSTTQMVDQTTFAAIESAAAAAGYATVTGKIHTIPLSALKGVALHWAHLRIADWFSCRRICLQYQIWATTRRHKSPPFSDDPAFDIKVNLVDASGTVLMVVTIPYFAKCNAFNSKGEAVGCLCSNRPQRRDNET